ncbi:MAG TPA: alanine racemase [Acidimicrobiia bacterium]|nr:alanine racemase [Acidimicrobiia bacterium]
MADAAAFVPRKRAEVCLDALRANTSAVVGHVGAGVQVMAMVKSNGYGHGLGNAAQAAVDGGATWLGVASSVEALDVVPLGVPVLIVGRSDPGSHDALVAAGVHTTVYDGEGVEATADAAGRVGRRARVHVKVDTGMGRLGVQPEGLEELLALLVKHVDLELAGVFTNFADSDGPDLGFTEEQHARFVDAVATVRAVAPEALAHCSNTGAILRAPHMHHDLVRPGLALYGYAPDTASGVLELRLAMTMLAPVTQVKTVPAGAQVGYGRTWTARVPTRVATVAAGYADGVLRALSNAGVVLVERHRCPIVGRVSMDQLCVDVSAVDADVRPGDDVVLFGERDGARLGADEVAVAAGTIEREILTAVPDRIPRVVR